jgi:hypothetical protein
VLKGMNEIVVKNIGKKISSQDINNVNKSSIKNAVPQLHKVSCPI